MTIKFQAGVSGIVALTGKDKCSKHILKSKFQYCSVQTKEKKKKQQLVVT